MTKGGSITTLTYLGSTRVVQNYNVMGVAKAALEASVRYLASDLGPSNIRVNAISAGPIKTASARGGKGFLENARWRVGNCPLRRNTDPAEVGGCSGIPGKRFRPRRYREHTICRFRISDYGHWCSFMICIWRPNAPGHIASEVLADGFSSVLSWCFQALLRKNWLTILSISRL